MNFSCHFRPRNRQNFHLHPHYRHSKSKKRPVTWIDYPSTLRPCDQSSEANSSKASRSLAYQSLSHQPDHQHRDDSLYSQQGQQT